MASTFDGTFDATFMGATVSSITLSAGTRTLIQAYATKDDYRDSATAAKTITVYSGTVATPVISQTSGQNKFTITCGTAEAVIRYTTDGTTPSRTVGSTYSGEVTTTYGLTVKAFAYKEFYLDSAAATPVEIVEASWTDPSDITGVESWYDLSDPTKLTYDAETGAISAWKDIISGAKDFVQATGSKQPILALPAKDKVTFGPSSNRMNLSRSSPGLYGETNVSLVIVMKSLGIASGEINNLFAQSLVFSIVMDYYISTVRRLKIAGGAGPLSADCLNTSVLSDYRLYIVNYIPGGTSTLKGYTVGSPNGDASASGDAGSNAFHVANPLTISVDGVNALNAEVVAFGIVHGTIAGEDLTNLIQYCKDYYGVD